MRVWNLILFLNWFKKYLRLLQTKSNKKNKKYLNILLLVIIFWLKSWKQLLCNPLWPPTLLPREPARLLNSSSKKQVYHLLSTNWLDSFSKPKQNGQYWTKIIKSPINHEIWNKCNYARINCFSPKFRRNQRILKPASSILMIKSQEIINILKRNIK